MSESSGLESLFGLHFNRKVYGHADPSAQPKTRLIRDLAAR